MGLSNVPMVAPFPGGSVRFLRKSKRFREKLARNRRLRSKIWERFLKSPRFPTQRTLLGNRLKIEIYTDDCDRPPYAMASINWESGIGIGGILVVNDIVVEFFSMGGKRNNLPLAKGIKFPGGTN